MNMMILIFIPLLLVTYSNAFNFDIGDTTWRFSGDTGSRFGHSVSLHMTENGASVIVGAPKRQSNTLFNCMRGSQCSEFNVASSSLPDDRQTNPQTGQSLVSNGESLLSCAHLWSRNYTSGSGFYTNFRGHCTLRNKNLSALVYSIGICDNEPGADNTNHGFCLSGYSADGFYNRSTNTPFYFVGAPGAQGYNGTIFGIFGNTASPVRSRGYSPGMGTSLLGYSIAWGRLNDKAFGAVVAGAPRDYSLKGRVIIYTVEGEPNNQLRLNYLDQIDNPDGQVGSYFGASVCIIDLNNDGRDDLLVGAPFHSKINDEGKVYVYINDKDSTISGSDPVHIEGESQPWSRFGSTIANIGDINNDGFKDFAVGAPHDGNERNGAIYIYLGNRNRRFTTYSQVIRAADVPNGGGLGFGRSISGGIDVDGNGYPDIAVGSPNSGQAFLFRSSAVLRLADNLQLNVTDIPLRENCRGPNNLNYHCVMLTLNLQYSGVGIADETDIEVTIELDRRNAVSKRAFIADQTNQLIARHVIIVKLTKNTMNTMPLNLYFVANEFVEVSRPIEIATTYTMVRNSTACGDSPCPVLDPFGKTSSATEISYLRECGPDKECNPEVSISNARLDFPSSANQNQSDVIYGALSDRFSLRADILNTGELAYQSMMKLNYSTDFRITSIEINGALVQFQEVGQTLNQVTFTLGNPIQSNRKLDLDVNFVLDRQRPSVSRYSFHMFAFSFGNDTNELNNIASLEAGAKVSTCVQVISSTNLRSVNFPENPSKLPSVNASVEDLGPEIVYTFLVRNAGRLPVSGLLANIQLAGRRDGKVVLYVVDLTAGDVQCSGNELNPMNLTVPGTAVVTDGGEGTSISRKRREIDDTDSQTGIAEAQSTDPVTDALRSCEGGGCRKYTCRINNIEAGGLVTIAMKTRFYLAVAAELGLQNTDIAADIEVTFNGTNANLNFQEARCNAQSETKLLVAPLQQTAQEPQEIEWWIILLAVIGALSILAVIASVLYWVGFFRREKTFEELRQEEEDTGKPTPNEYFNEIVEE